MRSADNRSTDNFFGKKQCDRCGEKLIVKTMSWFTEEAICMNCSDKEFAIKVQLRKSGIKDAMEGCGYVPEILTNS